MDAASSRARPRWRRAAAATTFAAVVVTQLAFIVHAYGTPKKELGWQMFSESSQWQADVVRVMRDGRRVSVSEPFDGYWWPELAGPLGVAVPWTLHHADYGIDATLRDLQGTLDWAATHTPRDRATLRYEADITYVQNRRGPFHRHLESATREVP